LKDIPNVKVVGIHAHHSTRTKSLGIFKAITSKACECSVLCDNLEYIDLGGCLFGDKPGAPTFGEYAQTIVGVLSENQIPSNVKLIMEPVAALIASPVSYVCKVIGIKDIKGVRLVYTNGTIKHIAPQMNAIKFGYTLNASSSKIINRQVVSGYTCIEMDRFLDLTEQKELCVGDKVVIHNVGAYTMSLAPLFIEYFPAVIVKKGDDYQVVREHWATKEFTQKNNIAL
jgi:diaminopimelate decarboxylase